MAEFPALPVMTDVFIADTTHLSAEEVGVYWLLLMCAWRSDGCRLPDDDKRLAYMARLTPSKWRKMRPVMMQFFRVEGGFLKQKRLTKTRENVAEKVSANKRRASAGGKAKALKNKELAPASSTSQAVLDECSSLPNQNQSIEDISSTVSSTSPYPEKESPTSLLSLCPDGDRDESGYSPEFETFWQTFRRKNDKKAVAYKSWVKAIRKTAPAAITEAAKRYIGSLAPDKRHGEFQAMASTWLNQQGYLDTYQPFGESRGGRAHVPTTTGFQI